MLLDLIHEFSRVGGQKINIQKIILFLYPNENWNLRNNTIYDSIKDIQYLEINLTKDVKDWCIENYKALLREIKDLVNEKRYCSHG